VLLLREADVRALLPMAKAIERMRAAFIDLAAGRALNQPRRRMVLPTRSVLHAMAGAGPAYFGTKVYATHPQHGAHFLFLLYEAETAAPLAIFEANYLGQIRTGAVTGLATDLLSAPDAGRLGLIGSGFQARSQLEAVLAVRKIREVRVWSRSVERRSQFAAECERDFGVPVRPVATAREAVEGAPIVVTATSAREPVLEAGWIAPGALVNAIGSNQAARRELPGELVHQAGLIVVDSLEQARIESGDLLLAVPPAEWHTLPLVELADVIAGKSRPGPSASITIFKSNGLGLEDVYAAAYVFEKAREAGCGSQLPIYS
jgi:ornithine cyclodeaminase/alanine dehydrogenase-like protein (mu-crystallin family)